jgi:hypothetical protein
MLHRDPATHVSLNNPAAVAGLLDRLCRALAYAASLSCGDW